MSLDISHGFRFRTTDLARIHAAVMDLRRSLAPAVERQLCAWLAREAAGRIDRASIALAEGGNVIGERDRSALSLTFEEYRGRVAEIETRRHRDPQIDFHMSVAILPTEEAVLGLCYTEQEPFREALEASPLHEPFAYWSGSDRPGAVSEHDWNERARLWETALRRGGRWVTPAEVGFSASVVERPRTPPRAQDVAACVPGPGERAREIAKDRVLGRRMRELAGDEEINVHNGGRLVMRAASWLAEPDGAAALRVESAWVLARLLPEIGERELTGKLEEVARRDRRRPGAPRVR